MEVCDVGWVQTIEGFVDKQENLKINSELYRQPMERD